MTMTTLYFTNSFSISELISELVLILLVLKDKGTF